MPSDLVAKSVSHIITEAASELLEIKEAGARELKPAGMDLQPVKPYMLRLPEHETALVIEACDMLFAALFEYEDGLWVSENAKSSVELVKGRITTGRADAVIKSLFHGPTHRLLWLACDRAPIAYSGLAAASPTQQVLARTLRGPTYKLV